MRTLIRRRYGAPDVLEWQEAEVPAPPDDGLLVRPRAASLNRVDWYKVTGTPYAGRPQMGLRRPKEPAIGLDVAGTVEAVGADVTGFRPGDEVFGRTGAFAELVLLGAAARKPANVGFEEAAAVPVAAVTALQGLRDKGRLEPGQLVLVNGASGGVGTFAVQIAKALGAEVTAVCSTGHVDLVRSLGADHVVDYTREDFTRSGARYDLLLDNAGTRSWRECRRVLAEDATVVLVGGPKNRLLGPLGHVGGMLLASRASSRTAVFFIADINGPDLETLGELLESGRVRPVVERRYELPQLAEALAYVGEGHCGGKVVVTV